MLTLSEQEAAALYAPADGGRDAAHDFDHVLRVARMGAAIAEAEGADVQLVWLAALLHDVPADAGGTEAGRADHHRAAAEFARKFLTARGIEPARVDHIVHCIEAHRFRDQSVVPQTLEARVLYDADKLDSMGAIGVLRAAAYAARHGHRLWTQPVAAIDAAAGLPDGEDYTPSHEYVFKLRRLIDTLQTETGRRLGRERHLRMVDFFAALDRELSAGEDAPSARWGEERASP